MTEWHNVPIGELCVRTTSGGTPSRKRSDFFCQPPEGVPWVKSQELVDARIASTAEHITEDGLRSSSAKLLPANTVLVAMYGATVGRLGYLDVEATVNQAICALITDPAQNCARFVYYALLHDREALIAHAHGAAQQNLSKERIRQFSLRVPDLPAQHRIAAVLGTLDDLIENNRRRIELLEQMAQMIYREWFIRFHYPGHGSGALVGSPLGPVPEGWEVCPLTAIADLVRGRSYSRQELLDSGGVPFVNLKCMMRGGGFRRDGLKRYAGKYTSDQQVTQGDIVLAVTDLTQGREILARATLVPQLDDEFGVISLDVVRIVPKDPEDRLPVLFALRCTDFSDRVKEFANGSTVLHLSPTHVAAANVVWPAQPVRRHFTSLVEPMLHQLDDLSVVVERLAMMRDLLLPRLVTGQIDVSSLDIDAVVESVA